AYLYLDLAHPRAAARLRRLLRERKFDVFCLNDSPAVGEEGRGDLLGEFLERYFPLPSSFELPAGERAADAARAAGSRSAAVQAWAAKKVADGAPVDVAAASVAARPMGSVRGSVSVRRPGARAGPGLWGRRARPPGRHRPRRVRDRG